MIIDGRAISRELLGDIRTQIAGDDSACVVRAITVSPNAATLSYLRIKQRAAEEAGMTLEMIKLPDTVSEEELCAVIAVEGADAVIVQLPLPAHLDTQKILDTIPTEKDADVLSSRTRAEGTLVAPVAAAVEEILMRAHVEVKGKRVVVIGKGMLVGEPVSQRLAERGAEVTSFNQTSFTPEILSGADIIVSGAGVPHLVKPEMLTSGVVLIDAGTSEQGGALAGDIDPSCADLASVYTPVPGGLGPIAVACLFRNVAQLRKRQNGVH